MNYNYFIKLILFSISLTPLFNAVFAKGEDTISPLAQTSTIDQLKTKAELGDIAAQSTLGTLYFEGIGLSQNFAEANKWWQMAANQGDANSQYNLGMSYNLAMGVTKDDVMAAMWWAKASEQGEPKSQYMLGNCYKHGRGVPKNDIIAYKWNLLAAAQGLSGAKQEMTIIENYLTPDQRQLAQQLAHEFEPSKIHPGNGVATKTNEQSLPEVTGSGFFITEDGFFITNQHVARREATVRVFTALGIIPAKVIKVDELNDLTLLKAEGKFAVLPVVLSRGVQLGATVATVGFPNIGLQGFSPKLAKGEIASLAGIHDDARHFQISVPVQPGNSGGALVDERGNVIGVVVAKISQKAALATSGALAENVNYAIKSSYLLSFLESVPEVAAKLKEPNATKRDFESTIKDVEKAAVLVLVY
jgi:TPR repeat protein